MHISKPVIASNGLEYLFFLKIQLLIAMINKNNRFLNAMKLIAALNIIKL